MNDVQVSPPGSKMSSRLPRYTVGWRRWRIIAGALLLGFAFIAGALEIVSRVATRAYGSAWGIPKNDPRHYYRLSSNPLLAYELAPGVYKRNGLRLVINRYGVREDSDDLAVDARRVALLGDSVGFGIWQAQKDTLASRAQSLVANERVKLLNLGVPGYAVAEVAENFEMKDAIYNFDDALYLLNLNDFTRRDTVYEGADNGLYRMYRPVDWHTRHLLWKAYYRWKKHGHLGGSVESSDDWYRWLFEGNRDFARQQLERMAAYAEGRGIRFAVMILPVGSAFNADGAYRLADLSGKLGELLDDLRIDSIDPASRFSANPRDLIDETEHPTKTGNRVLAEVVVGWIDGEAGQAAIARRAVSGVPAAPR